MVVNIPSKSFWEEVVEAYSSFPQREKARLAKEREDYLRSFRKSVVEIAKSGKKEAKLPLEFSYQNDILDLCNNSNLKVTFFLDAMTQEHFAIVSGWAPNQ